MKEASNGDHSSKKLDVRNDFCFKELVLFGKNSERSDLSKAPLEQPSINKKIK